MLSLADLHPADPTVLPPRRLGALLTEAREVAGLTIADLAATNDRFGIADLELFERGMGILTNDAADELCESYGIDAAALLGQRNGLVIDVTEDQVLLAAKPGGPLHTATHEPTDVLARYLGLLYATRGLTPGREVALRDADVAALAFALQLAKSTVIVQLRILVTSAGMRRRQLSRRRRILLPATALIVGVLGLAGLALAVSDGDGPLASRNQTPLTGDLADEQSVIVGAIDEQDASAGTDARSVEPPQSFGRTVHVVSRSGPWLDGTPPEPWTRCVTAAGDLTWFVPETDRSTISTTPGAVPSTIGAPVTDAAPVTARPARPRPATPGSTPAQPSTTGASPTQPTTTGSATTAPATTGTSSTSQPSTTSPGSSATSQPKITAPAVTTPPRTSQPVTVPPITIPPVTSPAATPPPITSAPVTVPPVTSAPVTVPPVTDAPLTIPPVTLPPITAPPITGPPLTTPVVTLPPVTLPPITAPPITVPPVTTPPVTIPPVAELLP